VPSLALAAIGRDRPGIVAAVTRALFDLGCNIEDSSMTLLRGNFAMMLVVATPDGTTAADADAALRPACETMGLTFSVLEVDDRTTVPQPTHVLVVHGADRPGIVFTVCDALAERGVNITDLDSRLVGDVYALMLELEVPASEDVTGLSARLTAIGQEMDVAISLNERESDVL
jgi:glycine cleavage system transcriptional repressor